MSGDEEGRKEGRKGVLFSAAEARMSWSTRMRLVWRLWRFLRDPSATRRAAVVAPFARGVWALGEGAGEAGRDRGNGVAVGGGGWL